MVRIIGLAYRKITNKMGNRSARISVEIQGPNRTILRSFMVRAHTWRRKSAIGKVEGINERFALGIKCERFQGACLLLYVFFFFGE